MVGKIPPSGPGWQPVRRINDNANRKLMKTKRTLVLAKYESRILSRSPNEHCTALCFDKLASRYLGFLTFVATLIWLR